MSFFSYWYIKVGTVIQFPLLNINFQLFVFWGGAPKIFLLDRKSQEVSATYVKPLGRDRR